MADGEKNTDESPLSITRLTNAFAAMLGRKATSGEEAAPREAAVDTRSITEAILFVGHPENKPLSAEAIAGTMRDITPDEVAAAVEQLNAEYAEDGSAMVVVESAAGYRMTLRDDLARVRDKFYGKVQQATLTPAAMEVLSIIAYRQPVELKTIDAMRAQKSQSLASSLVRRGLVEIRRSTDGPRKVEYSTTARFLEVFHLASTEQLPQSAEFEAA